MMQKTFAPVFWIKMAGSLLCAHFLIMLGRSERFFEMWQYGWYFRDLLFGGTVFYLLWTAIERVSNRLDRRYDWAEVPVIRTLLQTLFCVLLPGLAGFSLAGLYWKYVLDQTFADSGFLIYEFPVAMIFLVLINLAYLGYYFFLKWRHHEQQVALLNRQLESIRQQDEPSVPAAEPSVPASRRNVLLVNRGAQYIPMPVSEIAYLFREGEIVFLRNFEGETFHLTQTLEELSTQLDEDQFFRANRQMIISLRSCVSFRPIEYGKLELSLRPEFSEAVTISQKRAPFFRSWIDR